MADQKMIRLTNRGSKSNTADKTIEPAIQLRWDDLTAHVTGKCYQLLLEFGEFLQQQGLRRVDPETFLGELKKQLGSQNPSEAVLTRCFDGAIYAPLQALCQKLTELHAEVQQAEQSDTRALMLSAVRADSSNFDKMLLAFEQKVAGLTKLNQYDAIGRKTINDLLDATNRCVERGEQLKFRLVGRKLADSPPVEGLEQELDNLVRQTAGELAEENSDLCSKEGLEERWRKLERLLLSYQDAKQQLAVVRTEYAGKARQFFIEHDGLGLYKGEWQRQREYLRYAEEFFRAAELDPFDLSEALSKINRKDALTMPDQESRAKLEASTPNLFPDIQVSRVEDRVKHVVLDIMAALEVFDKPPAPPPLPPEAPPAPIPLANCPLTVVELALCTFAAFVARYSSGKPYHTSGRTARKVYDAILTPTQLTYGCTENQFTEAINVAVSQGWMRCFQRPTRPGVVPLDFYQPTLIGFKQAETLQSKLPADFGDRILAGHEKLQQDAADFREKYRKKPK